jgi:hypothetical protein
VAAQVARLGSRLRRFGDAGGHSPSTVTSCASTSIAARLVCVGGSVREGVLRDWLGALPSNRRWRIVD